MNSQAFDTLEFDSLRMLVRRAAQTAMGRERIGALAPSADPGQLQTALNAVAEMIALRAAAATAPSWRLDGVTAYVTLEPCVMCAGAFVHARIARVVYGCDDPKGGAVHTLYTMGQDSRLNHRFEVTRGVLADECATRLRSFFAELRAQGKK